MFRDVIRVVMYYFNPFKINVASLTMYSFFQFPFPFFFLLFVPLMLLQLSFLFCVDPGGSFRTKYIKKNCVNKEMNHFEM